MGVRRCDPARLADHRPPGQVMEAGPAEDVADAPLHPDTIALTAVSPVIDVDKQLETRQMPATWPQPWKRAGNTTSLAVGPG